MQAARDAGVPVILDAGGMDADFPEELLSYIDILSPNETELSRLTRMPTDTFEDITQAVSKCYQMVSFTLIHYITEYHSFLGSFLSLTNVICCWFEGCKAGLGETRGKRDSIIHTR